MSVLARCSLSLVLGALCSTVATCGQKGPLELPLAADRVPFGRDVVARPAFVVARVELRAPPVEHGWAQAPPPRPVDHAVRA